jgi:hypothetical protein
MPASRTAMQAPAAGAAHLQWRSALAQRSFQQTVVVHGINMIGRGTRNGPFPPGTENNLTERAVNATCRQNPPRILIGVLTFTDQLPRPKQIGGKFWVAQLRSVKSHRRKKKKPKTHSHSVNCKQKSNAFRIPAESNSRSLIQMGKRLASFILFKTREREWFLGLLARVQLSLFAPASLN